nr:hypothetical protein [Tanacetum cinerariifolium]
MRTRSSSNLPGESSPNPTTSNPKCRNRRRSNQPFILEESPVDTMVDQRTMAELLRAPTEGYPEGQPVIGSKKNPRALFSLGKILINTKISFVYALIMVLPNCTNLILSTCLKPGQPRFFEFGRRCNLLERRTQDVLMIIENKSKVRNSQNKSIVSQVKSNDANSSSSSEIAKLTHAVNQQTSAVTTAMTAILKQFQATPPPASVKAVEEIYVICGGAHPYYQCLAADGNTFLEFRDNIQGYVSAAAVNYNQGELEKIKKINEINMKAMQTQINNVKNELRNEMKTSIQASMSNQTNELKNMMASFFQMNTAFTSGSGPLPSSTIANPKGKLKAITTRSGIVLDGPSIPMPPPFINLKEDERVEETLTDPDFDEFTIKVPPPLVQKSKSSSQRNYVVHQRDPLHPNIPYPSRMHKQKQQEKDKKMLKALLSNKEKLLELENTPLIKIAQRELKCKALADLGASINLMPLSVWKHLGLPELISTSMTLELANRTICTLVGIARDIFIPVGKFTFPADFVIVDYESDHRAPLILGRPFLRTARTLIDVHREEMILRDGDERLTLNMRHDTSSYSNQPKKESINMINIFNDSCEDFLEDLYPPHNINPSSGGTTSSSPNHLLEEFADELALITFPPRNDDLPFDIESDLRNIEYLLNHDPIKEMDSTLKDWIDESNLAEPNVSLVDTIPEMFTDEHALDYSSPSLYDDYDDDLFKLEPNNEYAYDDPFDSKGEKIKEFKLLIDELDLPRSSDFLPSPEYDLFLFEDFFEVDALPLTNNEDEMFNPDILIHERFSKVIVQATPDNNVKKIAISHASLILEDFDPPLYELPCHKEVPRSETLLSFSIKNKEIFFKHGILTSKGVHNSFLPKLSHRDPKVFKIIKILESPMKIFPCSFGEDIRILHVPYLYLYPP